MDICSDVDALRTLYVVKSFLNIGKFLVPFILIIYCSIDIYKVVIQTSYKPYSTIFRRFVSALLVFFIATIIDVVLSTLGQSNISATACWANANRETIAVLQEIKEAEIKAKAAAEEERREAVKKAREEELKKIEIYEDKISDSGNSSGNQNVGSNIESDYSIFHENGSDGKIVVKNGIFYKPSTNNSGTNGTKGSAPYGYNKFFYERLVSFINAAAESGYTIGFSTDDYGAWRPYSKQKYFYDCYISKACNKGRLAAVPGRSNHGWGIASDLSFSSDAAKYWAHDNCNAYGLNFNLCENIRGNCKEYWHIEPSVIANIEV